MSFYRALVACAAALLIAGPVLADDMATATTTTTQTVTQTKVDLNKASAKDLMKVKGLNAAKARAIVAYRKKHGDFKSVNDLMNVKGFKKMKEEKMKEVTEQVTVE